MTGMPAATALWIDGPERGRRPGSRRRGRRACFATAASISWAIFGMSNVSGAAYSTVTPEILGGLVDAVLDDRPERVGGLAILGLMEVGDIRH